MSASFDENFRGWYPGSKVPLPPVNSEPAKPEPAEVCWDARPYKKIIRGKEVEFFTIGAVAKALCKSVVTIRVWIRDEHLPPATFRLPEKNNIKGRRLYTRAQIEALVDVATRHQILEGTRVNWSKHESFAAEVRAAWEQLPAL